MGARISFTNHIHIAEKSFDNGLLRYIGYKDITPDMMEEIARDSRIQRVQIDRELPKEAYEAIDRILERRPDLYFRIFSIGTTCEKFDLSVLGQMPHLSKVWLKAYLRYDKNALNMEYLCELPALKGLHLDLFDCRDYRFVNQLSHNLEELILYADTMGAGIQFDCEWLLQYGKLQSLLWCGNSDLSALGGLESLRELELWRIMKLENLDFLCSLKNLEILKLQDLKHIKTLPDLRHLKNLKRIYLDNVPVNPDSLDESVRNLIHKGY